MHQDEHVALGVGHRVPPALAAVVDDHHLAGAAAVLQAVLRAVFAVQAVAAALQQQRAAHGRLQLNQFLVVCAHVRAPAPGGRTGLERGGTVPPPLILFHPDSHPAIAAAACAARPGAARERPCATKPCGTGGNGDRGSILALLSEGPPPFLPRWRKQCMRPMPRRDGLQLDCFLARHLARLASL